MFITAICALLAVNSPPTCVPSEAWTAPASTVNIDGAAGVEVNPTTGEVMSIDFDAGGFSSGTYESVHVKDGRIIGTTPITEPLIARTCTLTITVTNGLASIRCFRDRCDSHCGVYSIVATDGVKSYYCGCNLRPK